MPPADPNGPLPGSPLVTRVRLALTASGGVLKYGELVAATSRHAVAVAAEAGAIARRGSGHYVLRDDTTTARPAPTSAKSDPASFRDATSRSTERAERVRRHRTIALTNTAVLSHRSAAEYHQLPLLIEPTSAEMIVPPGRRVRSDQRRHSLIYPRKLAPHEHTDGVTNPLRTVLDCAADLPFAEALAIADSALRSDDEHPPLVGREELLIAAGSVRKQARGQVRLVAELADGRAANPFESAVRALVHDIPDLTVTPQCEIDVGDHPIHVDLADRRLRIVLEADSYAWHADNDAFENDCDRYNLLTVDGWYVLRLTWKAVMLRPDATRCLIERLVQRRVSALT